MKHILIIYKERGCRMIYDAAVPFLFCLFLFAFHVSMHTKYAD